MTLTNCVKQVLCGLSAAVQNALVALIKGYIAQLDLYKAQLEAKLVYLAMLSTPPQVLNSLAQTALSEIKAGANIVPLDLVGRCFQVGELNEAIQENLNIVLADANTIANDLSRLLSFRDEVEEAIADVQAVIDLYTEIVATIDACATVGLT